MPAWSTPIVPSPPGRPHGSGLGVRRAARRCAAGPRVIGYLATARRRHGRRRAVLTVGLVAAVTAGLATGCTGGTPSPAPSRSARPVPTGPIDPRSQLAGLAAAAKDRRFIAGYTLTQPRRPARLVQVTMAADGSWRVDVPGGALGGGADISIAAGAGGVYQCRLGGAASGCVRVAAPGGQPPAAVDPRVQRAFTDWLDVLTDRQAPLTVAAAPLLPGARGACFSVEPNAASLLSPLDAGIYCYDPDGTLTGLRVGFGTLVLATPVAGAPRTATLPGPVVAMAALPTQSPPAPPPSPTPSRPR